MLMVLFLTDHHEGLIFYFLTVFLHRHSAFHYLVAFLALLYSPPLFRKSLSTGLNPNGPSTDMAGITARMSQSTLPLRLWPQ
jgi:hypothetical protein